MTAMTIASGACAIGAAQTSVGQIGGEGEGDVSFLPVGLSGIRIAPHLRLRVDVSDRIPAIASGISPMKIGLIDIRKHRRMGMMVDYFPASGSGLFLSAGWRKSPARSRWSPGSASNSVEIFVPAVSQPLSVATNVARQAPAMMAGWSGPITGEARIGVSAGAMQEHARAMRTPSPTPSLGDTARWSRVGALAQVNFGWQF